MAACLRCTTVAVTACRERLIPLWTASDSWSSSADVSQEQQCKSPRAKLQMSMRVWRPLTLAVFSLGDSSVCVEPCAEACILRVIYNMWEVLCVCARACSVCAFSAHEPMRDDGHMDLFISGITYASLRIKDWRTEQDVAVCFSVCVCVWDIREGQPEERHITKELLGDILKV